MEQKPEFDNSQVKVGKCGYVFFKEVGLWVRPTKVSVHVWKDNINSDDICIKVDGKNNLVADNTQFKSHLLNQVAIQGSLFQLRWWKDEHQDRRNDWFFHPDDF